MSRYSSHFNTRSTPQIEPMFGTNQVKNSAGGYSWEVTPWDRLQRFLILGSEGGSYYANERGLTRENAMSVVNLIKTDGKEVVRRIVEVSDQGRAVKNSAAIFALAMATKLGDDETRQAARRSLLTVCRIPTHLFEYVEYIEAFGGWTRGIRSAVGTFYNSRTPKQLAFHLTKYKQRNGWSHQDVLRLAHVKAASPAHERLYALTCEKATLADDNIQEALGEEVFGYLQAIDQLPELSGSKLVETIVKHRLPMEVVPTNQRTPEVYEAMLGNYGITALLRNLGNLTRTGVLASGKWKSVEKVTSRLTNLEALKKGRVHPLSVLIALKTYSNGRGMKGKGTWTPIADVKDALNDAFYKAFDAIEPTNKRYLLGLDVSGSMSCQIAGMPISCREAAAAMSMVTYRTEKKCLPMAFTHQFVPLDYTRKETLENVVAETSRRSFGRTDCSLPMEYAIQNKLEVDTFIVYTDSETYAGRRHPAEALRDYRDKMGIPARLIVVGMVSNNFTIADPNDKGMMDVVGFDTSTPAAMAAFSREEF